MLTVVQVLACHPVGGAESVVRMLASGLHDRGHRLHVVAVLDAEPASHLFEMATREGGIEVVPLRLPPRAYGRERRKLTELLRQLGAQVVHTHGYRADVQAGAVARRLGLPAVSTVHGFTGGDWKNRLYERLQERALRSFDAVVAVSRPLVERLRSRGVPAERIMCVPNAWRRGVDALPRAEARRVLGLANGEAVLGWVGRLSFEKGADLFLEALARIADVTVIACVVGDGPERAALVKRAESLGLGSRVRWAGVRLEAGALFGAFDGFVLSSRTEGTPIVLFEAMDAGVPIVATRVGGVPDVVSEREARLVEPERPDALAAALDALRANPNEAAKRALSAQRRLEETFRIEPWLDAYEALYQRLAIGCPPSPQRSAS
jgi:glycosyltransferase involved in cell wall biosynthesis